MFRIFNLLLFGCLSAHAACPGLTGDAKSPLDGKVVLVVDDYASLLDAMETILLRAGVSRVVKASSGEDALTKLEGVDAVITDNDMGAGMDGVVLSERIKALHSHLPVVLHSSRYVREGNRGAADVFINKGIEIAVYREVLERLLKR